MNPRGIHTPYPYTNSVSPLYAFYSLMEPLPVMWKTHVSFPRVPETTDALASQGLVIKHLDLVGLLRVPEV